MAHFLYTRAGGIWADDTDVLRAEMADLDAKTYAAINGDAGGTWAPSSTIIIGGQGVQIDGNFVCNDPTATFNGNVSVAGSFNAGSSAFVGLQHTFGADANIALSAPNIYIGGSTQLILNDTFGPLIVKAGTSTFDSTVYMNRTVVVNNTLDSSLSASALTVNQGFTVHGVFYANSPAQFNSMVDFRDTVTGVGHGGPVTFYNSGRICDRPMVHNSNLAVTVSPVTTQWVLLPAGVFVPGPGGAIGGVTMTIGDAGCREGDSIGFTNLSESARIGVATEGGAAVIQIEPLHWAWCKRMPGGSWVALTHGSFKRLYDDYASP